MSVVPTGQLRLLLVLAFLLLFLLRQHDNVLTTGLLDDGLLPEKARHKRERERERETSFVSPRRERRSGGIERPRSLLVDGGPRSSEGQKGLEKVAAMRWMQHTKERERETQNSEFKGAR